MSLAVSVIIPTRDRPDYLRAAVASVCRQVYPPTEIVVVEDGEGAGEALRAVRDRWYVPIRVVPGRGAGPAAARNTGIRAASGELLALLDDDDLWHPGKLLWQVEWMERRPDVGVLGTETRRCDDMMLAPGERGRPRRPRLITRAALVRANRLTTSSVVVRRECFESCGGFDESLVLAQDWDLWLRLSRRWRIALLPAALTIYRLHGKQRSRNQRQMRYWEARVVARVLEEDPGWWLRSVARRRLAWAQCRLGRARLREQLPQEAAQAVWQSLRLYRWHFPAWSALVRCALRDGGVAGVAGHE